MKQPSARMLLLGLGMARGGEGATGGPAAIRSATESRPHEGSMVGVAAHQVGKLALPSGNEV